MRRALFVVVSVLALCMSTAAQADAVVHVKVRNASNQAVDGRVELSGQGGTFTCTTSQGNCTLRSVPGGRYTVVFKPKSGSATAPKKVMIPPDGSADLLIAAK